MKNKESNQHGRTGRSAPPEKQSRLHLREVSVPSLALKQYSKPAWFSQPSGESR